MYQSPAHRERERGREGDVNSKKGKVWRIVWPKFDRSVKRSSKFVSLGGKESLPSSADFFEESLWRVEYFFFLFGFIW